MAVMMIMIMIAWLGQFEILYSLLSAPRTVSNTYDQVARM